MEPGETVEEREVAIHTIDCPQCGIPLDVTGIPPHTLVECSRCHAFARTSSVLGRYQIIATLGVGGMSLVYRAKDTILGREVALKVLNQTYSAQPERVKMFAHEAEVMARVSHPNVVKVYSVGDEEGCFFIAMELVEGSNLDALVTKEGKLGEKDGLKIALEIAEGLRAGYEGGVLHRDMKPANVLFNMRGEAQIVDFGLSLLNGDESTEEEIWVTPHYAPPETLERLPEDFRSDVYAFGATMFQIFSGHTSIEVKDITIPKLLEAKKHIPLLGEVNSRLSVDTCRIIDRCLRYAAEERYSSYDTLITDIKNAQAALLNRTSRTWKRSREDAKRRKIIRYASFIGGGCLLAGGLALLFTGLPGSGRVGENGQDEVSGLSSSEKLKLDQKKMAETYLTARTAFQKKDYAQSAELFSQVFHSPVAPEATAAWASLEAYMGYLLIGNKEKGKIILSESIQRFSTKTGDEVLGKLMKLAELIRSDALIDWKTCRSYGTAFSPVYFLSGYRAWERGELDLAKKCFSFSIPDGGEWEQYLATLGKECYKDMLVLFSLDQMPEYTSEETRVKAEAFGKAAFSGDNLARQTSEHRQEELRSRMAVQEKEESEREAEIAVRKEDPFWNEGKQLLQSRQFEAASAFFNEASGKGKEMNRPLYNALARSCGMAQGFIDGIATYILFLKKDIEVHDAGNRGKRLICGIKAGNPVFKEGKGQVTGKWTDIAPVSLAHLYKESVSCMSALPEERKRHMDERALHFFFLMGDRSQGAEMERGIVGKDPSFSQGWKDSLRNMSLMGI